MIEITPSLLAEIAPHRRYVIVNGIAPELAAQLPRNGFDSGLRVAHFLAQAAHETDGFQTLEEYASGEAYEGRDDLGNTHAGDGKRYKGRGVLMVTGRTNYRRMGARLEVPLEDQPELLLQPRHAVGASIEFWLEHVLSYNADRDDIVHITRVINGGLNGLESRKEYLVRAKRAVGL
jgi:putative chitinase